MATSTTKPGAELPLCPLCNSIPSRTEASGEDRSYFACEVCALLYLHPAQRLSAPDERGRYELHRNDRADPDYVNFLRRLADPMVERLQPGARGLDFGCGPVPVLSELFTISGFPCVAYDPFFAPDEALLDNRYDFIVCSEVIEHVHDPAGIFARLRRMLAPGGLLGIMTRFYVEGGSFANWWYRRDPTHVCFYSPATMRWIGQRHAWRADFPAPDVTIFTTSL